ncbi:MAG: thioredoxin domain-containing protein, partial [Candidatus Eiseniibacteriota bacterium]
IKVDREERPDVDRLYMTAMQAMGLGGGWPLNAFLTPDLEPFYGGTYFPPRTRMGRPGMMDVLPRVHDAWERQREQVVASGRGVIDAIAALGEPDGAAADRESLFVQCARYLAAAHDAQGGFSAAPKFPSIVNLNFLMRWWARDPAANADALAMVRRQLDAMQAGGIHDHLGGGFHRYATDREWLVPHFEKMLYDQAQIAWAFLEGFQATGDPSYAATARDIFAYVSRDLSAPEGGFYSAEDADSEGEEGRFYVWTKSEIEAVAGPDALAFVSRYGVTSAGNFEGGGNILQRVRTVAETAADLGIGEAEAGERIERAGKRLLEVRGRRVRPHRDDKVLTAWNGLMISAFARGARVLEDDALEARAERAARFVWERLHDRGSGALTRRWREGEAKVQGQLDDYAYYALGLIDLYQATFDPAWLERATRVTEAMVERFWDEQDGGFFESPAGDSRIKVRMKDGFDGAEMAGNSIAALDLQLLGTLLDRRDWQEKARRTFDHYARRLATGAAAMPQMLVAMDLADATPRHVVIAGRADAADTRAMIAEVDRRFLPHEVLLLADGGARQKALARLAPFVAPLARQGGRATAYVCVDFACRLPTTDRHAFAAQLDERASTAGGSPR